LAAMTPWQNRVGQASNMQALAFSRHLGKCCSRKKAKNEKSGRLFSRLLKLHFLVVDQRRLMYFSVDIIISAGPLGQTKAERFDRSNTHKMTLFHGAQLVTKAAAVAPLRNTRTWSVTKSSSGLSRRTLRLSSAFQGSSEADFLRHCRGKSHKRKGGSPPPVDGSTSTTSTSTPSCASSASAPVHSLLEFKLDLGEIRGASNHWHAQTELPQVVSILLCVNRGHLSLLSSF